MRKSIVLAGGPWNLKVYTHEEPLPAELRFPDEPCLDIYGRPSICAPRPAPDGPHVYVNTGQRNFLGDPIFRYQEVRPSQEASRG